MANEPISIAGEEVVSAISSILRASFTSAELSAIYKEKPMQKVSYPYAFVHQINMEHKKELSNRYMQRYMLDIRVHPVPSNESNNTYLRSMSFKILEILNSANIGGQKLLPKSIETKIQDDVLHVIFTCSFRVIQETQEPVLMKKVYINSIGVDIPESHVAGEYFTGIVASISNKQILVDGALIPQDKINYSLLVNDSAVWNEISSGEEVVLLRAGDQYFVLDTLKHTRLKPAIDGGEF